jgi:hypothetical protein
MSVRASYRHGVDWIALNDNAGEDTPSNPEAEGNVASYISTSLLADLFDKKNDDVARDVMRARRKFEKAGDL